MTQQFDPEFAKLSLIASTPEGVLTQTMFEQTKFAGDVLNMVITKAMELGYAERTGVELLMFMMAWANNIHEVVKDEA